MKIILVRHGEAEDPILAVSDSSRKLTEKGLQDIEKLGRFIRGSHLRVTKILHSPYLRTRATAEILTKVLGFEGRPESTDELAAGAGCHDFLSCLQASTNSDTVLLVGHNPDLTYFAAELLGNRSFAENLVFQPGSSIAINVAKEKFIQGQLLWAISPDLIDL